MTDPADPAHAASDRRKTVRRGTDPPVSATGPAARALMPASASREKSADPKPILSAHLMGQDGQKRGLRGGPETLGKAKAAYLTAEWSGPGDRRTRTGLVSKTKV